MKHRTYISMMAVLLCVAVAMSVWATPDDYLDDVYYWPQDDYQPTIRVTELQNEPAQVASEDAEPAKKPEVEIILDQDTIVKAIIRR